MKKNIVILLIANVINLFASLIINFILPKYLSIASYGELKTFTLYMSYAGFLSLGYCDGMYLKYGGKILNEVNTGKLEKNLSNFVIMEIILSAFFLLISIIVKNMIIALFSIGFMILNISGYIKELFQATGEIKLYSKALNYEKYLLLLIYLILIFVIKKDNYVYFIISQIIIYIIILMQLLMCLKKNWNIILKLRLDAKEITNSVKSGFVLMLGNFSVGLFSSIDRWFIKIFINLTAFAKYSFAAGIQNLIMVFVTPLSISFYNYMCKNKNKAFLIKLKRISLVWSLLLLISLFPIKFIVRYYIPKYLDSIFPIIMLISSQSLSSIITSIYVNIYKVNKKQNKYFKQIILIIILSVILNGLYLIINMSANSVALATLTVTIIWLLLCEYENKEIRFILKEYIYLIFNYAILIICYFYLNEILGLFIYGIAYFITTFIIFKAECIELFNIINNKIDKFNILKKHR